jgi:hypothetical protein
MIPPRLLSPSAVRSPAESVQSRSVKGKGSISLSVRSNDLDGDSDRLAAYIPGKTAGY